jgi:hypothetical protein
MQAILDLVAGTTEKGGADFGGPGDRIATFNQDVTLWIEHAPVGRPRLRPHGGAGGI